MDTTILLSKVFGIYLIIGGIACIVRRKFFMSVINEFVNEHILRLIVAASEFAAGLFLIFAHNTWTDLTTSLISAFGWVLAIEGAFYLFVSDRMLRKIYKVINTKPVYVVGGLLSLAAGIHLVNYGFNLNLF